MNEDSLLATDARVLAIDLGGTKCHGVVADGAGEILHEVVRPTGLGDEVPERLLGFLRDLRGRTDGAIRATAIGVPALIDTATGLAELGQNVSWHGYDVTALMRSELEGPLRVDNDVNLAALGEAHAGHGRDAGSFVTLSLGTGIGAAIVIEKKVLRGHHNAAGEVGYLSISRAEGAAAPTPSLEALISGPGLQREAVAAGSSWATAESVLAAAADGDVLAQRLLDAFLERVASLIADVGAVVDPQTLVLDGGLGRALGPWLSDLQTRVNARIPYSPEIVISRLTPSAAVVGAIWTALQLARNGAGGVA